MKKVFISGIGGNMGTRYAFLCSDLGIAVYGMDKKNYQEQMVFCLENKIDRVIIATPTWNHVDALNIFSTHLPSAYILCEKPIIAGNIRNIPDHTKVTMVNQYKYLLKDPNRFGITYYNYFKTGNDGLYWDCINIIGLAKGKCYVKNDSPFFRCIINGQRISIKDIDRSYMLMVKDWFFNPKPNIEYIKTSHAKVLKMIRDKNNRTPPSRIQTSTKVIPILGKDND
jgi:hypothetical protein